MKIQDAYTSEESTLVLCAVGELPETLTFRHAAVGGETYDILSHERYNSVTGEQVLAVELKGKHEFYYEDEIKLD